MSHLDAQILTKHEILSRLSHELRTPLNSVIGFSNVLRTNRAGNQRAQDIAMLESIRANGERLLDLLEDLFDVSGPPPDDSVVLLPVNVAAAAAAAVRHQQAAAAAKGISLDLVVEAKGMAELDAARLVRLLRKLVGNAVKFTERGGVMVTVRARAGSQAPASIVVQDSGIGVPAELQATIFQPFTQAQTGTERTYDGAGLGLPVARTLAESMGCRLTMASEVGVGSQFVLLLPFQTESS
ncbi:MAG TPA: sensor histidine kinase [Gemmatimonadaceae bacterium]